MENFKEKAEQENSNTDIENNKQIQKKPIIILNGTGGSGKNTFVDFINETYNTQHISIVDCVKEYVHKMGLDSEVKDETFRRFLSDIKLALEAYKDIPYQNVISTLQQLLNDNVTEMIFIDMREPHDIERISKEYKIFKVLIYNPNINDIVSNIADASVYNIAYDYIIENSGDLNLLKESAETMVKLIMEEIE